jgi:hypothetical protein
MPISPRQTHKGIPLHSKARGGGLRETVGEIPPEFRSALDLEFLEQPVPYDTEIPMLSDTILSTRVEQNFTSESTLRQITKPPGIVTLEETYTDKFKQIGDRIKNFRPITDLPLIAVPSPTRDVQTNNLGNFHFVETIEDSGTLFTDQLYAFTIPDVIPEEYRVGFPTLIEEHVEVGIAEPVLDSGELEHSEHQENVFVKRVRTSGRDVVDLPRILINYELTPEQQIMEKVGTLDNGIQTLTPTATTLLGSVKNLGNNTSLMIEGDVPDVFNKGVLTKQRDLFAALPLEFRSLVTETIISFDEAGLIATPTLTGGQTFWSEKQITEFKKNVEIRGVDFSGGAITLVGKELTEDFGGGVLDVIFQLDDSSFTVDEGYRVVSSKTKDLSGGFFFKETKELSLLAWPVLSSRLWDENMRVEYDETKQVVDALTAAEDPAPGGVFGWISEVKAIDKWRSWKVNISKPAPAYVDEASALISYIHKPYRFPGLLYYATGASPYYVRSVDATLVQHKIKTWWEKSVATPTVAIDDIILDDVVIPSLNNINSLVYSGPVLHDDYSLGVLFYPATTPSYTQYALGTPTGTSTLQNYGVIQSVIPGGRGTNYAVGDTLTITDSGHVHTMHVTLVVDFPGEPAAIGTYTDDLGGTFPPGFYGPFFATGGSGTGALFQIASANVPNYTPGSAWKGTYRVIGASVTPEKEKNLWKIQTESVIMR